MPDEVRKKLPGIYDLVRGWYQANALPSQKSPKRNELPSRAPQRVTGGVLYVAHAITGTEAEPVANRLAADIDGSVIGSRSGQPSSHPDQYYWRQHALQIRNIITGLGVEEIIRIEIDCSLLPCFQPANLHCCAFRVPDMIKKLFTAELLVPLRIYAHRSEQMGGTYTSTKRVIFCNSSDSLADLRTAYNANLGWAWGI